MVSPNLAAGEVSIDLKARGVCLTPATACASGVTEIALAHDLLAAGLCDIVGAGGVEVHVPRMKAVLSTHLIGFTALFLHQGTAHLIKSIRVSFRVQTL